MRRFLILFVVFMLFLTGCNDSNSITFKGKSDTTLTKPNMVVGAEKHL